MYQGVHNVAATPDIPRRLPRGTHGLDPSLVAASQRTRLLEAVGRAVAEKGYAAATIDDIVRGAGVSKKTFYEHFQRQARLLPRRIRDGKRRALRACASGAGRGARRRRGRNRSRQRLARAHARGHPRIPALAGRRARARAGFPDRDRRGRPRSTRTSRTPARPLRRAHARATGPGRRRTRRDLPRGCRRSGRPRRAPPARRHETCWSSSRYCSACRSPSWPARRPRPNSASATENAGRDRAAASSPRRAASRCRKRGSGSR